MTDSARELLDAVREELAPGEDDNRLVPLIEEGKAARSVFAMIAAEENLIVRSDWRTFLMLAGRSEELTARKFFSGLAQGEGVALDGLGVLARAMGLDDEELEKYEPNAGCQAYPAFLSWLALNSAPADAIVGVVANFSAWGEYCAKIAVAMREQYGFSDEECAFFDFFAEPDPDGEEQAIAAVQAALDAGECSPKKAHTYGRLFQVYELMFWNTLADQAQGVGD